MLKQVKVEWFGKIDSTHSLGRIKVPGGWLVLLKLTFGAYVISITFFPDPEHTWDGKELPLS